MGLIRALIAIIITGVWTDLRAIGDPGRRTTIAAVDGRRLCAFGMIGEGRDTVSVGIGMISRDSADGY